MKIELDEIKAWELRGQINRDSYCYMYELERYYELCTIMDRLEDTVVLLNSFELPSTPTQFNATDFISWINYADLIINCIMRLNDIFVKPNNTTLFQDNHIAKKQRYKKPFSTKFFGKYYKGDTDDNYFKFLRAMVLAHSLKIDCKKFCNFTNKKLAYTPLVRWNHNKNVIEITYYVPDYSIDTQTIELDLTCVFDYIKSRYNYLDEIFDYIIIEKEKDRNAYKQLYKEKLSNLPTNFQEKLSAIERVYHENGDLDAKNGVDRLSYHLQWIQNLISFEHNSSRNKIDIFHRIIGVCVDDIAKSLEEQNDELLIDEINTGYDYQNDKGKFKGCVYEINKIHSDYSFVYKFEYLYEEYFEKVKDAVGFYFEMTDDMSLEEKCYLAVIALCFDNILSIPKLKQKFPIDIQNDLESTYGIKGLS